VAIAAAIPRRRAPRPRPGRIAAAVALILTALALAAYLIAIRMPGASFAGPADPFSDRERALAAELRRDVSALVAVGDRSMPRGFRAATAWTERALGEAGYAVERQPYEARGTDGVNLVATLAGSGAPGVVVVGAHHDAALGTPGANDNGSGVAALLALARALAHDRPRHEVRFVAFAGEEPPTFQTEAMGSLVYAHRCRARGEAIHAMISLETLGFYTGEPGSQRYPSPFDLLYPSRGDFVAFVGDVGSRALVRRALGAFRRSARFPSEGLAAPAVVPGVGWSDHWSFWQVGYPAVMVTDTAIFRYDHYHQPTDTPDRLTYEPMARVVLGLSLVVRELASE
jgi:hypothetical protein